MPDFNINNNTNLTTLFFERILYQAFFGIPEDYDEIFVDFAGIKDYWSFENFFYGKVNQSFQTIRVSKSQLVSISQDGENFYLLSEPAKAFQKMQKLFQQRLRAGQIAREPYLSEIKIHKAYEDPDIRYNKYITGIIDKFNNMIIEKQKDEEITDVKDYFKKFLSYILESGDIEYFNRSAYYMSSNVSSLSSGMSIEIADLDPSDNSQKQIIIDSPNFEFYRECAVNFGFIIDKNIPWRLNFDLSSPVVRKELDGKLSNLPLVPFYLSTRFVRVLLSDIDYMVSSFLLGYNTFVEMRPVRREGVCIYRREKQTIEDIRGKIFSDSVLTKNYILIKNKEIGNVYSTEELEKIIFNANDLPTISSFSYISNKFEIPYYFEGSSTYTDLKRKISINTDFPLDKFSSYVKMLLKKKIKSIY
tara:strand:+ start:128 stop:1378 length:1251 start_codon:yes stop_codon:yes gene_type:complete